MTPRRPLVSVMKPAEDGDATLTAAEFFAGIGLVRSGLESAGFEVVWSNDIEPDKQAMYAAQFDDTDGDHTYVLGDVGNVHGADLPRGLSLAWASFPCTDLSLAGNRSGLQGGESSTFWHFTRILGELADDEQPPVVALENVSGLATSHGGDDLAAAVAELNELGYSVDVLELDARRFVPQSRPRLFIIGAKNPPPDEPVPNSELRPDALQAVFGDPTLITHRAALPAPPPPLTAGLSSPQYIERLPANDARWWDETRTAAFLDSLSPMQATRLEKLRKSNTQIYRTAYRRTRHGVAVWEVRPDDISGCLRTARGGSSKQAVVQLGRGKARVRWMTPREYARLQGAGDFKLDTARTNQALFGFGDAVCVPVIDWLSTHYLVPLIRGELGTSAQTSLMVAGA